MGRAVFVNLRFGHVFGCCSSGPATEAVHQAGEWAIVVVTDRGGDDGKDEHAAEDQVLIRGIDIEEGE